MDHSTFSRLSAPDKARLRNSAKIAQQMENVWAARISDAVEAFNSQVVESIANNGTIPDVDFEPLFVEHFFETAIKSTRYAMTEAEEHRYIPPGSGKLAKPPAVKIPRSLAGLMQAYDAWRKNKSKAPKRAKKEALEIKKKYLQEVRSVWEKHSGDFRKGVVATQEAVVRKIQEIGKTTARRAAGIVRTSTTNYYNQARKQFYDGSSDITHYLLIAIRDAATSPWCTPLTVNGYRGRSGLVYSKKDPLCEKERPACHPYCRSEYLPLNRLNPAHLKFIQDEKIQRRNHTCYPLLKGWSSSS